jgi:hypothetical protein
LAISAETPTISFPPEPIGTILLHRSCCRATMRQEGSKCSDRQRERAVLVSSSEVFSFLYLNAAGGLEADRTGRKRRTEQQQYRARIPEPRGREGSWLHFFSSSFFLLDHFSLLVGLVLGWEGLGRQIYPWVVRLLLFFFFFDLLFWRFVTYTLERKQSFVICTLAFHFLA